MLPVPSRLFWSATIPAFASQDWQIKLSRCVENGCDQAFKPGSGETI
ncbi:MAG: hypothetical protein WBN40_01355 [Pseudomonadales bacterium]